MDAPIYKEIEAAKRALKRYNDPILLVGDGMIKLYCSLRKIHGRVSHNMLREHYNTHPRVKARLHSGDSVLACSEVEL